LHKLSTALVEQYGAIFIGNVNASALAKTRMAKSVLDAGWSLFRTMLQYKGDDAGVWFEEFDEAYSTQTCSCCKKRTGPKGPEGPYKESGLAVSVARITIATSIRPITFSRRDVAVWQQESPSFPRIAQQPWG
jgi:hypothetical protein